MRTIYVDPFPVVASQSQLDDIIPREWAECARCMAIHNRAVDGTTDYAAWAKAHVRSHPTHDRFRLVTSKGFRVTSRLTEAEVLARADVCGELKILPDAYVQRALQETGTDWSDITVSCALEPHDGDDHMARLMLDGEQHGEYHWNALSAP
ncbi:DUF7848 domain-containing protein [Streptomyces fuscichromogenes]|uniref:DUF7848 domain-containing protein n=1 Tax=Streptomyces fuscichromogenes TaxID=1324013 RepID=A0A917XM02_9ACTN|nr:hypothetical protein [Streptomyces fuscichromogenes]GGN38106.1 hypothetical protein GCM10011578_083110 [Streptomyces fuscichromogenes]